MSNAGAFKKDLSEKSISGNEVVKRITFALAYDGAIGFDKCMST